MEIELSDLIRCNGNELPYVARNSKALHDVFSSVISRGFRWLFKRARLVKTDGKMLIKINL